MRLVHRFLHLRVPRARRLWRAHLRATANHAFALWPLLLLGTYLSGLAAPAAGVPREAAAQA